MSAVRRCVSVLLLVLVPACAGFALPVGGDSVQFGGTNFSTGDDYLPKLFSALVTYEVFHYPGGEVGGEYLYTYEISSDDVSICFDLCESLCRFFFRDFEAHTLHKFR